MDTNVILQIISNVLSFLICIIIVIKYLSYKKRLDVLQGLEDLKCKEQLTLEDKNYIKDNEAEYQEKALKAESNLKIINPILILITGIIFAFQSMSDAMIYMNVVVVSFLYFILDKNHKKTTYTLLHQLKKEL